MSRLLKKRAPSPDQAAGRPSFSSIRERDCDYAQSFTSSKISSYMSLTHQRHVPRRQSSTDEAVADDSCSASPMAPSSPQAGPESCVPCAALDCACRAQDSLLALDAMQLDDGDCPAPPAVERSGLERLPLEVFRLVLQHLIVDIPPNGIDRRNVDLMALLVTSSPLYSKTMEALYRQVTIPHSRVFQKFLVQLAARPERGLWVRRLDFSHFNPISLFSSFSKRDAARNLTSETLLRCLALLPELREFLAQDYLDVDLHADVLRMLLTGLPRLEALDLCGASSPSFRDAFSALAAAPPDAWPRHFGLQRLSLHKCLSLTPAVFEFLLPKLDGLTHLDVAGTRITDAALHSIPATARLTHLNLAKCSLLTADGVLDFLAHHPAVRHDADGGGLVFLSLSFDATISELLEEHDVARLLAILPPSLRSLSLRGSKMHHDHLPALRALSKHLEELALGRGLTVGDASALVVLPPAAAGNDGSNNNNNTNGTWVTPALRYLDLTDLSDADFSLSHFYLDSGLLDPVSAPLEVIEVSDDVFKRLTKSKLPLGRRGWRASEIGSRSWLVRGGPPSSSSSSSSTASSMFAMKGGQRPWKMGAQSWGMRKLPVAHAKVGGMYGSYMFGRKL